VCVCLRIRGFLHAGRLDDGIGVAWPRMMQAPLSLGCVTGQET